MFEFSPILCGSFVAIPIALRRQKAFRREKARRDAKRKAFEAGLLCFLCLFAAILIDLLYRVSLPSTRRIKPRGFSSCNSGGSSFAGKFWKHTGRANLRIAAVPTLVKRWSVVAGYGPP